MLDAFTNKISFSYDTLIDAYTEYAYDKEFINELKEQTVQKAK